MIAFLVLLAFLGLLLWLFVGLTRDVAAIRRLLEEHLRRPPSSGSPHVP